MALPPLEQLICCPVCDALHVDGNLREGAKARCIRCHAILADAKSATILRVTVLSMTALILMTIVVFMPFLELRNGIFGSRASVFDTVMSFDTGLMTPLAIAVGFFIIVLPTLRFAGILWSLSPLAFGLRPLPGAAPVLRFAETIRPWAMAEIFMVGVVISLVKLADLATLNLGPAFWSFCGVVVLATIQDLQMTKHTLWTALETASRP